jgi:hypothetical protein
MGSQVEDIAMLYLDEPVINKLNDKNRGLMEEFKKKN